MADAAARAAAPHHSMLRQKVSSDVSTAAAVGASKEHGGKVAGKNGGGFWDWIKQAF
jgi:hypothetical protein